MKTTPITLLLHVFLFIFGLTSVTSQAQSKLGFETGTSCLKVTSHAFNVDSSCQTVAWYIDSSSKPVGQGKTLIYTFAKAGTYTICMAVYDFCLKKDTQICTSISVKYCDPCDSIKPEIEITPVTETCGKYYFKAFPESNSSQYINYVWSFGEGSKSEKQKDYFRYTTNDSYDVCIKFTYTVSSKNCEKILCQKVVVNCYKDSTAKDCGWGGIQVGHSLNSAQCGKVIFEANAMSDTCVKTEYFFNNTWKAGRIFDHSFTENGTYKYGFRYRNTCTGCDTTIYNYVTISCFPKTNCLGNPNFEFINYIDSAKETCSKKYYFVSNKWNDSCFSQKIKIVSGTTVIYEKEGGKQYYTFEKNGYYNVCFWFKNNCNSCDTWVCKTVYVNCEMAHNDLISNIQELPGPNPTSDWVFLHNTHSTQITLFDRLGKVILKTQVLADGKLDMRHLPAGHYTLSLTDLQHKPQYFTIIKE
jgi:hypothetical protein